MMMHDHDTTTYYFKKPDLAGTERIDFQDTASSVFVFVLLLFAFLETIFFSGIKHGLLNGVRRG